MSGHKQIPDHGHSRCSLAYMDLVAPPGDLLTSYGQSILELDMSHNKVTDLRFLTELPSLQSLVLDHNHISSHVKIPLSRDLHTLWVNHNRIENLGLFVTAVCRSCPSIRILSMMNNAAAPSYFNGGTYQQYTDYRYFVISNLPKLEILDDKKITPQERSEARRLYPVTLTDTRRNSKRKNKKRKDKEERVHEVQVGEEIH